MAAVELLRRVRCIHCWESFRPEDVLWVSEHGDLLGDPILGSDGQRRFLPTRFAVNGQALDARGIPCRRLACPHCHLTVPRALLELEPLFVSILGAPSAGKSFFLGALTWKLRRALRQEFGLSFEDADPEANQPLLEYERALFLNERRSESVPLGDLIAKTQLGGDLYNTARQRGETITYAKPFPFVIQGKRGAGRLACLYDNSGEHFLPGADSARQPGTRHLTEATFLLFLLDPTQDRRMDRLMAKVMRDPNYRGTMSPIRQEVVLTEAADRIRTKLALPRGVRHKAPLFVVVTKSDLWGKVIGTEVLKEPWERGDGDSRAAVSIARLERASEVTRAFLDHYLPEVIHSAEALSEHVHYVPVSALGSAPKYGTDGRPAIKPSDIRPQWVEVPFIWGLAAQTKGIVPRQDGQMAGR